MGWRASGVAVAGTLAITSKRSVSSQAGPLRTEALSTPQARAIRSTMVADRSSYRPLRMPPPRTEGELLWGLTWTSARVNVVGLAGWLTAVAQRIQRSAGVLASRCISLFIGVASVILEGIQAIDITSYFDATWSWALM